VADRRRIEHTAEIATADLADLLRRETLLHHQLHYCVVESDLLVRPSFALPPAAATSAAARTTALTWIMS